MRRSHSRGNGCGHGQTVNRKGVSTMSSHRIHRNGTSAWITMLYLDLTLREPFVFATRDRHVAYAVYVSEHGSWSVHIIDSDRPTAVLRDARSGVTYGNVPDAAFH